MSETLFKVDDRQLGPITFLFFFILHDSFGGKGGGTRNPQQVAICGRGRER